jgi:hypothetical protein
MNIKICYWLFLWALLAMLGCGGSGGSTPSLNDVTVTISPTTVTLAPGAKQTFGATATNAVDPGINWSASGGSITSAGVYTAPTTVGTYTVTASSNQDSKFSATATVTVSTTGVAISINPSSTTMLPNGSKTFTATVTGTSDTSVAWTCSGGTITQDGVYKASDIAGTYSVTAQSKADRTQLASCRVVVGSSSVLVTVSPTGVSIGAGETQQFTASVAGITDQRVTWTASGGTITSSGLYTAPTATGSYTVTATSVGDTSASASSTVNVSAIAVTLLPDTFTVTTGRNRTLTATVTGAKNKSVTWSATAGTITSAGVFTAPSTAGTVTITARSTVNASAYATATATVVKPTELSWDFQSGVPSEWSPITPGTAPSGQKFLGRLGQGATASLTLSKLSPHTSVTVTYDLYIIGRWDGETDSDTVQVKLDGTQISKYSYSNVLGKTQSYPTAASNPGQDALGFGALGYTFSPSILYNDTIYRITFTVDHTSDNLYLAFIGNPHLSLDETSWGIDNVTVTANP